MLRSILVPVDGSPFGEYGLGQALEIAEKAQAVVHVAMVHVPDTYTEVFPTHSQDLEFAAKTREKTYLDDLKSRVAALSDAKVQYHHLEGIVAETLEEEVAERKIDLIVMSSHGWGYVTRAILGSTTDRLVRRLTVPTLIAHPPENFQGLARPKPVRRMLITLDGSELAEKILPPALELGNLWRAEFGLLKIVRPPAHLIGLFTTQKTSQADHELIEKARDKGVKYLEQIVRSHALVASTKLLVHPRPSEAIIGEITAGGWNMVAMATHGRGGVRRLALGSVSDKVMRGSPVPVLIYHPGK